MSQLHLLSPRGFKAAGVYAGIKSKQANDVGLLVCDGLATAAAVFTTNKVFAAPVKIGREHIAAGKLRGVVVNAGNANACTGRQGEKDARAMCQLAAKAIGAKPQQMLPSSTGIIGHPLPMDKLSHGITYAAQFLGDSLEHALDFGAAILTTDLKRKAAAVEFNLGKRKVTLAGVCKGSGMIGPRLALPGKHATMLAYLTTDADVPAPLLRKLLGEVSDLSFNAVTIDDHTSTNDTVCLLASGLSEARIAGPAAVKHFRGALLEVCQSLAEQIAADGEGATKTVKISVRHAASDKDAKAIARAIANSPLVKCAMNGNDPNWGRIVSAAGYAPAKFNPERCVLMLAGTTVFRAGQPVKFDPAKVNTAMKSATVAVDMDCRLGKGDAVCWTCDLSKEYVTINADYHT